jgi:outer membrane protein insertion porin family
MGLPPPMTMEPTFTGRVGFRVLVIAMQTSLLDLRRPVSYSATAEKAGILVCGSKPVNRCGGALAVLALAGALAAPAVGQEPATLRSIQFEGNRLLGTSRLLQASGLEPGQPWNAQVEAAALQNLGRFDFLESAGPVRVSLAPDGRVDLVIPVVERPLVVAVGFAGNERFTDRQLREHLRTLPGKPLVAAVLDEDRQRLQRHYQDDGYLLVRVDPQVAEPAPGSAAVTFRIEEWRRVRIRSVEVLGNEAVSNSEVRSATGLQPVRLFGFLDRGYYRPWLLEPGLENLRERYRFLGYLDVAVAVEEMRLDRGQTRLDITLQVSEGPRYVLEQVRVTGHRLFPTALLLRVLDLETGGWYAGAEVEAARRRLFRWYQERSERVPAIGLELQRGPGDTVAAVFRIDEGRHHFVRNLEISGNWKTKDRVIRRHATVVPGGPLTVIELEDTRRNLERLGYFDEVSILVHPPENEVGQDVEIIVAEKEFTGFFEVGGGTSSGAGEVAYARVHQPNFDLFRLPHSLTDWTGAFAGGGQSFELEIIPGTRESQYLVAFQEPYFFSSRRVLTLSSVNLLLDRLVYDENRWHGEVEVRQFLEESHRLSAALAYRLQNVEIEDLAVSAPPDVEAAAGHTWLAYPRLALAYEDIERNIYSGPRGIAGSIRADIADTLTGSNIDFLRLVTTVDWFQTFFDRRPDFRHLLRLGVEAGWVEGRGAEPLPFFERFFLGGPRSFRGFDYRRVGPHQLGVPVGGEALLHGTIEYSLPLFFREVRAVAVFDWGNLEPTIGAFSTGRFRTAAGGGLELRLPLLGSVYPANIYFLQALSKFGDDRPQLFTFTVGLGF